MTRRPAGPFGSGPAALAVLESGRVLLDGTAEALLASEEVKRVFLGL